jgi:preprotein translocase subunit SecB
MANETAGAGPANEGDGPVLSLQSVYLKDCSYEAPNGPRIEGNWSPQISLDLQTGTSMVTPDMREVVLTVTVAATSPCSWWR